MDKKQQFIEKRIAVEDGNIIYADGMFWCALCGDAPPTKECLCGKHICKRCDSLHSHNFRNK